MNNKNMTRKLLVFVAAMYLCGCGGEKKPERPDARIPAPSTQLKYATGFKVFSVGNARLVEVPKAGHMALAEQPDIVTQALLPSRAAQQPQQVLHRRLLADEDFWIIDARRITA